MSLSHAPVVFRLPPQVWNWWMFPSGSTRPLQPTTRACRCPASSSFSIEANSVGRSVMWNPASCAIPWMISPTRRCCGSLVIVNSNA